MTEVIAEIRGSAGLITLNRSKALNALSLAMIRDLTAALLAWVGANEVPGPTVLAGGALVIGALVANEVLGWRQRV